MKLKSSKSKGVWKKRLFISLMIVFGLIVVGISYWNLSLYPKAFLIKKAFEGGMFVQSDNYKNAINETQIVRDINYNSKFPDGTLDIIYPKIHNEKTPVIFWVHGGWVCWWR